MVIARVHAQLWTNASGTAQTYGIPDGVPAGGAESVRGYFVIAARDEREALEIARGCPHLRHGGWIVVRPIAPV